MYMFSMVGQLWWFSVEGCFQSNPDQRPTVTALLERLAAIAETKGYNLKAPLPIKSTHIQEEQVVYFNIKFL